MKELNELLILRVEIGITVFSNHDTRKGITALKEKRRTDFSGKY